MFYTGSEHLWSVGFDLHTKLTNEKKDHTREIQEATPTRINLTISCCAEHCVYLFFQVKFPIPI